MRHQPSVTPTSRLILQAVARSTEARTPPQLAVETGASFYTGMRLTQDLCKRGVLVRESREARISYFSVHLPGLLSEAVSL